MSSSLAWLLAMTFNLLGAGVALALFNGCAFMFAGVVPAARYRS